jgi:protein SCO1/2|tara:strand:+ start:790 stop:1395 length:606 start_codon:yes stop_codon:yes gene_type:complete
MFLKKKFLLIIFALILVFLFFYKYNNKSDTQIGGDFELTNHLDQKTTNNSFNGYYRLVFFGFTNCPDFCPNTLNNIGLIINQINKKNQLVPIFITVDPERDTVIKLKKYLINFDPKIIGLTGTKEQIEFVKIKYKIFSKKVMYKKKDPEESMNHDGHDHGAYSVDHTTIIYLMDKKGNYITHFSPDTSNSAMVKKINKYLL